MDVTCERCKAEYEFDDSLLGEGGTTVKCSSCQHVFRVAPAKKEARPELKLRYRATGRTEMVGSLRDLQRKIHEGAVTRDDELGREGFPWRRLGDVPELKSFFAAQLDDEKTPPRKPHPGLLAVSQSSVPAPQAPANGPASAKRTMVGMGPQTPQIPPPPRLPNVPGVTLPAQTKPMGSFAAPQAARPTSEPPRAPASQPPRAPTSQPPRAPSSQPPRAPTSQPPGGLPQPNAVAATRTRSVPPPPPAVAPVPSARTRALYLAEDEAPPARATEAGSKSWMYIAAAMVLAIGGWIGVSAVSSRGGTSKAEPPAGALPPPVPPAPSVEPTPAPTDPNAAAPSEPAKVDAPAKPAAAQAPSSASPTELAGADTEEPKAESAGTAKGSSNEPSDTKRGEKTEKAASNTASSGGSPSDYTGWVSRGDALVSKGDFAEAQKAYEAALAVRASGSEANAGLGQALLSGGKAREAIAPLERAAKNGYAEAQVTLGDAYKKLGRKEDAEEAYNTYLVRLPSGARAAYVKSQLAALNAGGGAPKEDESAKEPEPKAPAAEEYQPAGEAPAAEEPTP